MDGRIAAITAVAFAGVLAGGFALKPGSGSGPISTMEGIASAAGDAAAAPVLAVFRHEDDDDAYEDGEYEGAYTESTGGPVQYTQLSSTSHAEHERAEHSGSYSGHDEEDDD